MAATKARKVKDNKKAANKTSRKAKLSAKVSSAPKAEQKAKKSKSKKVVAQPQAHSEFIPQPKQKTAEIEMDAAHAPGHRKLNRVTAQKRITGFVNSAGQRRRRSLED